jgi:hypothetical protein
MDIHAQAANRDTHRNQRPKQYGKPGDIVGGNERRAYISDAVVTGIWAYGKRNSYFFMGTQPTAGTRSGFRTGVLESKRRDL